MHAANESNARPVPSDSKPHHPAPVYTVDLLKEQLQNVRTQCNGKANVLRDELALLELDVAKFDAALAALEGTPLSAKTGKTASDKQRKKIANPTAGKADVIKIMQSILSEQGMVEQKTLKALVEAKATEAGFTRMGLSLRFKEALAEAQFIDTPTGIRLNKETTRSFDASSTSSGTSTSNGTSSSSAGTSNGISHTQSTNQNV